MIARRGVIYAEHIELMMPVWRGFVKMAPA